MADIPVLNIYLNDYEIGTLVLLPGDRNIFSFNQEYIEDDNKPILSLSFKDTMGGIVNETKPRQTRLPPFFSNLLPEGRMHDYLAARAGIKSEGEFFLLWMLGADLPGAVKIKPAINLQEVPRENREVRENIQNNEVEILQFSLAGIQLKFSAVNKARGGLTIPANGIGGSWVVKLPDTKFQGVPENEFVMMQLAKKVGIDVPEIKLVPIKNISGLPKGIELVGSNAYAIKRFDRDENGNAIHIEDFAQVFNVYPENKYKNASYRNIAHVIWSEIGEEGIIEFVRRLVFNILIGNGDMHLKNWSLIYPDGRTSALAPAYDFVATIAYIANAKMALKLVDSKSFAELSINQLKRFAAKAGLPEKIIIDVAEETVKKFKFEWPHINDLGIEKKVKKVIDEHLVTIKLWKEIS